MNWLENLIIGQGIAHSIVVLGLVIAIGILCGKIKIFGISLGVTWILFIGIIASHFGLIVDPMVISFTRDFGLILFVYSLGMQVGPGFFSSFKSGGVKYNILALLIVILGAITTYILYFIADIPLSTMVGVMSGAVTNTPGLGAAQQTYLEVTGSNDPTIAMAYAVSYPLGVVGVVLVIIFMRRILRINISKEKKDFEEQNSNSKDAPNIMAVEIFNEAMVNKTIKEIEKLINRKLVLTRLYHADGNMVVPSSQTIIKKGDRALIISAIPDADSIAELLGKKIDMSLNDWNKLDAHLISRRLVVTKPNINGKRLGELKIRAQYGINVSRIIRSGMSLIPNPNLQIVLGDRLIVVGNEKSIDKLGKSLGNYVNKLREPNLFPIFFGIALGVLLGSLPIAIPGMSQPVKLGLAGGPIIVAILIARFGPKYKLVTYTTVSANYMLREVGMALFLAAVGLGSGQGFVDAVASGGYMWILYGFIITIIPLIIATFIARFIMKMDYFSIVGVLSGTQTNSTALAFANDSYNISHIAVVYATVYPLTMFMRVVCAQLMML
ncbi:MAG: putative transporter [Marinifilaceae bacterium]|jgi:putative transport protein|nr:putative transporter [Marinilabiliaceae bacterium JC040]MCT4601153.1 putative transporter [Marinifilaceae bacterium]